MRKSTQSDAKLLLWLSLWAVVMAVFIGAYNTDLRLFEFEDVRVGVRTTAPRIILPPAPVLAPATLNAFPGAYGYAATATLGSGDTTTANRTCNIADAEIHVWSSLATGSGPGTIDSIFNNEIRDDTLDIIVVNVAGEYSAEILPYNDDCYIFAGWHGPAPGLELQNRIETRGDSLNTHDIALVGLKWSPDSPIGSCLQIHGGIRVMLAYLGCRGTNDDAVEFYIDTVHISPNSGVMKELTLMNSIVGPLVNGGKATGCRGQAYKAPVPPGDGGDSHRLMYNCDIHHNFITAAANRCPKTTNSNLVDSLGAKVVSNAIYNCDFQVISNIDTVYVDIINNCIVRGPMTASGDFIEVDTTDSGGTADSLTYQLAHVLVQGNDTATGGGANPCAGTAPTGQWAIVTEQSSGANPDSATWARKSSYVLPGHSLYPIPTTLSGAVWPALITLAGAVGTQASATDVIVGPAVRINSQGQRIWARGDIDSTHIDYALNGGGPSAQYANIAAYGGPDDSNLGTGSAWTDKDADGLPDDLEVISCGAADSTCLTVTGDEDNDGYINGIEFALGTNIEVFNNADGSESTAASNYTYRDTILLYFGSLTTVTDPNLGSYRTWNMDSIPGPGTSGYYCFKIADTSEVVYITKDTVAGMAPIADSVYADSMIAAFNWSACDTADVKRRTIP